MALYSPTKVGSILCEAFGLQGITEVDFSFRVDDLARATVRLSANDIQVEAVAKLIANEKVLINKVYSKAITNCARCGGNHDLVTFLLLDRPCDDWTHWGTCPTNGEPIMMKMKEAGDE